MKDDVLDQAAEQFAVVGEMFRYHDTGVTAEVVHLAVPDDVAVLSGFVLLRHAVLLPFETLWGYSP